MRPAFTIVFAIAFSAVLASCSSVPDKVINPPRASIQQLAVHPDGHWQLTVRLQNFSSVSTAFQSVNAKLVVSGQDAGAFVLSPAISIGPESADVSAATLAPALGAKLAVASALAAGQPVRYVLSGRIETSDPKGSYPFTFESTLNPAPGLDGVMR
jgi:hypothetical protein